MKIEEYKKTPLGAYEAPMLMELQFCATEIVVNGSQEMGEDEVNQEERINE